MDMIRENCGGLEAGKKKAYHYLEKVETFSPSNVSVQCLSADRDGNFIERFKARMSTVPTNSTFHGQDGEIHLIGSVFDILAAGTGTVSTFLDWAVHYMICYPDVQVIKKNIL